MKDKDTGWPIWLASYRFDGTEYCFEVPARTMEEAQRRLRAIGMNGEIDGELIAKVPKVTGLGFGSRLVCAVHNIWIAMPPDLKLVLVAILGVVATVTAAHIMGN